MTKLTITPTKANMVLQRDWLSEGVLRYPSWVVEMRRHKLNFGTLNEEGWQRGEDWACSCVMAVFGWGGCTLIALCWSRPSPPLGDWPGFSPAAPAPGGWLTLSWIKGRDGAMQGLMGQTHTEVHYATFHAVSSPANSAFIQLGGKPRLSGYKRLISTISVSSLNISLTSSEGTARSTVAWQTPDWKRNADPWNRHKASCSDI